MTPELIQRLIALVQKHGDKVVLADPSVGSKAVVVLDLEEYERLREGATAVQRVLPLAPVTPPPAPTPTPSLESRVSSLATPPPAPEVPAFLTPPPDKKAETKPKKVVTDGLAPAPSALGLHDLTQEQLIDKINRDIGAWKTAQDRKRTDELKSAIRPEAALIQTSPGLEEEERFFLEPIE